MSTIICAVRGGPASQPTIAKAIQLAKETDCPLHFLYTVNLDFLSQTIMHHAHTVSDELSEMGEFILLVAQQKAAAEGITAMGDVRHGNFMEQLTKLCIEIEAAYVVLGQPKGEGSILAHDRLEEVEKQIEAETNAKVVWAGQEH